MFRISLLLFSVFCLFSCTSPSAKKNDYSEEKASAPFESGLSMGAITNERLDEVSGIVASRKYPGYYWVHNDSGGDPSIFLIDSVAQLKAEVRLNGAENRDWEDIAIGPGADAGYVIYIGDIGDNRATRDFYSIYALPEPDLALTEAFTYVETSTFSTYTYEYPDGARDAETLLVDPTTGDFLVISKREDNVFVYHWPFGERTFDRYILHKITSIPFWMIVGGDISETGHELLLKDYESIFYWKKENDTPWVEAIQSSPHRLPYQPEPQGEAIGFSANGRGFVTLSELKGFNSSQLLFFYPRKESQ